MIEVKNLCKTFRLYNSPGDRLKEIVFGGTHHRVFEALKDVSFRVEAGETLGVIGQNGAGKSTLLKLLTGVLLPDKGEVSIDGKITGLLELGTGFNAEFTGIQNIHLNGALLGMSKSEIEARLDEICSFSELGEFINEPLKTYSSGMVMRLGFSIAIHAEPKAFLVDEALSVGDAYFQQKCMNRIKQFKEAGGAIVFVSHDMNSIKLLCNAALLLDQGVIVDEGVPEQIVNTYNFLLAKKSAGVALFKCSSETKTPSYGNFKVQITCVTLLNEEGTESTYFLSGAHCTIKIEFVANETVNDLTIGILIRDRFGQDIFGTNTSYLKKPISMSSGEKCELSYIIDELNIGPGKYTLTVAAHRDDTHVDECYQWVDLVKTFEVTASNDIRFIGLTRLNPVVTIKMM